MVIVQALIVFFKPELIPFLTPAYTSETSASKVDIMHPVALLGFVTSKTFFVFGHYFTRFRSFAAEPSVLVCSFLVPGILALSYKGYIRIFSIPILFFCVFLAQAGTIWLSILLGVIAWGLFYLLRRRILLLSVLPFIVVFVVLVFITKINIPDFVKKVMQSLGTLPDQYGGLDKYGSLTRRLKNIVFSLSMLKS